MAHCIRLALIRFHVKVRPVGGRRGQGVEGQGRGLVGGRRAVVGTGNDWTRVWARAVVRLGSGRPGAGRAGVWESGGRVGARSGVSGGKGQNVPWLGSAGLWGPGVRVAGVFWTWGRGGPGLLGLGVRVGRGQSCRGLGRRRRSLARPPGRKMDARPGAWRAAASVREPRCPGCSRPSETAGRCRSGSQGAASVPLSETPECSPTF